MRLRAARPHLIRFAHLLVLSAFAISQPLLDILANHAEFFAVRGSTPSDIVLFALAVTFLPGLALFAVEALVFAVSARAGTGLHLVFVGGLAALFGIQVLERLGLDGTVVLIAGAVVLGAATALAVWRVSLVRSFLTILAPAPLVFLLFFLFGSPVDRLVFPADVEVSTAAVRGSTPVVLVILDELPVISLMNAKQEIDAERYPNFARLARDSTWFRTASTVSGTTTLAVPAILTGRRPRRGRLPVYQNHPQNLFTLLGGRYNLHVQESQTRICPEELCGRRHSDTTERLSSLYSDARTVYAHLVAPPALEDRLPAIDETWGDFGGDTATELEARTTLPKIDVRTFHIGRIKDFRDFMGGIKPERGTSPTLHVLHTLMPHGPFLYFPDGTVSAVESTRAPGREGELWLDDALALQSHQRHLLQLGFTDHLLGQFLDRLEKQGVYDDALVVLVADHGVSFRGGDLRRRPTQTNFAELAYVPLFVKRPGGEGGGSVVDRHVQTIDVLPTIADALEVDIPWRVDGVSAFSEGDSAGGKVVVSRLSMDAATAIAQRQAALKRQLELFGSGKWGLDVFRAGPYGALVGRKLGSLRVAGGGEGSVTVDAVGTRLLGSLPARSPLVPSPLAGTLSGVAAGDELLFALNGEIAAVARAYASSGGVVRFSALAPPTAFKSGANELRVFLASGPENSPELRELATSLG